MLPMDPDLNLWHYLVWYGCICRFGQMVYPGRPLEVLKIIAFVMLMQLCVCLCLIYAQQSDKPSCHTETVKNVMSTDPNAAKETSR